MERVAEISKPHEHATSATSHGRDTAPAAASLSPVVQLQQQAGNQAVQELLRAGYIRAKLAISNPDDPEEREADQVAHTIMRSHSGAPSSTPCSCSHDGEMCEECQQKQSQVTISRRASAPAAPADVPRIVSDVLRSPGRPLDAATRAFFEPRFGHDFGHVRLHTDSAAAKSARSIHAHAYTAGSDIVFAPGQYSPATDTGRSLLAHELTHTLQQSASDTVHRGDDQGESSGSTEGSGDVKGDWEIFDPQDPWRVINYWIERIDAEKEARKLAFGLRFELLLLRGPHAWKEWAEFDEFRTICQTNAGDEKLTLTALGDKNLESEDTQTLLPTGEPGHEQPESVPEAFPITWSEKLGKHFFMLYPLYQIQTDIERKKNELEASGKPIPDHIFDHGLPLDFPGSLYLEKFYLAHLIGVSVQWLASPAAPFSVAASPLFAFTTSAWNYIRVLNEMDFITAWIASAKSVVQQVAGGEISVDFQAFERYKKLRPEGAGVPLSALQFGQVPIIPQPLSGKIDPLYAENYVTSIAGLLMFWKSFHHAEDVIAIGNQLMDQANQRIAQENPFVKVQHARAWGHEHGFYSEALLQQWRDVKEHAFDIATGMAKDVAKYTIAQFIPGVNVIADIYLLVSLGLDVLDTMNELASADEEAQNAMTAAQLQRAAARQASATSDAARKVATAIAMHYGSKGAGKVAEKTAGAVKKRWGKTDEETSSSGTPARHGEEPGKVKERMKEQQERDSLRSSAGKSGKELSAEQALTERDIAHRSKGEHIDEPPFTDKYHLPNGHDIKETPQGEIFERCTTECGIYNSKGERIGGVVQPLIGTTRRGFRAKVAEMIRGAVNHPLEFLLGPGDKLKRTTTKGITHDVMIENPDLVEAGHVVSAKAGEPDQIILMSAWKNRILSSSIEHPSKGGSFMKIDSALDIGGIAVDVDLAADWVKAGLLSADVVAAAPRIQF